MAVAASFLTACTGSKSTLASADSAAVKMEKNKATVLAGEYAINKKDIDGIVKDCASTFIEYGDGTNKPVTNLDSVKKGFKEMMTVFPDFKVDSMKAIASGDTVLVSGIWTGTFKAPLGNMKPNGKAFKLKDVDMFIFNKDGKIISHSSVQSWYTILVQLHIFIPNPALMPKSK